MSERAGGMDERDVDERFASIISQWGSPLPTVPDAEGLDADAAPGSAPTVPDADDDGATPEADAEADAPSDGPPPARPSWVNPSPVDIVVPATAWRAADPAPADGDEQGRSDGSAADDEHFEPPAVRLPPQEDLHFWGAVIGLVAGPLMLLYVAMARPFHSTRWFLASVLVSLAGFALLVLRQPTHRDPTSGDDGARL